MDGPLRGRLACPSEDTLAALAEGNIDQQALSPLEEHLADCRDCRAVLARAAGATLPVESSSLSWNDEGEETIVSGTPVGRYIIEGLLGRGAMGAVYAAIDPDLHRKVAVKLLRAGAWSDATRQRIRVRLLREAQAMARLSHPEVITVYDVGAFGEQLFVAMEYVEGETLRRWRAARHRSYREILDVFERAGSGLAAAHEAGLVHRDFKPDNVLVGRDGRVRVSDFGLARAIDGADLPPGACRVEALKERALGTMLTRTGTLLGTPAYMAPEQLLGGAADARSDVFSFCVALYEALYDERPFNGSTVPALRAAVEGGRVRAAPVVTRVPFWLRKVLLRGLRPAPDERFASMRALLDALRAAHSAKRRRLRLVAGIALSAAGIVALLAMSPRRPAAAVLRPTTTASLPATEAAAARELPAPSERHEPEPEPLDDRSAPVVTARPSSAHVGSKRASTARPRPASSASDRSILVGNNGAFILE